MSVGMEKWYEVKESGRRGWVGIISMSHILWTVCSAG